MYRDMFNGKNKGLELFIIILLLIAFAAKAPFTAASGNARHWRMWSVWVWLGLLALFTAGVALYQYHQEPAKPAPAKVERSI